MSRFVSALVLAFLFGAAAPSANAQFNYNTGFTQPNFLGTSGSFTDWTFVPEYEVWGTNPKPRWVWAIVLIYEDGSEEVFGTYFTENDAYRWLLLAIDYELFDLDAVVGSRVERQNGRRPTLIDTFESRDDAEATMRWLDAFGWEPELIVRYRAVRRW